MANRNYYRVVLSNDYLGLTKEISAPTRNELSIKIENQERIWNEKIQREKIKQNREEMKAKAEELTKIDKESINIYSNIINMISVTNSINYYNSLIDESNFMDFLSKLSIPTLENISQEINVPKRNILELFSAKKKGIRIRKEKEAKKLYDERVEEYNINLEKEKKDYEIAKKEFLEKQKRNNELVEINRERYNKYDEKQIQKYFEFVIKNSKMPDEFTKEFELQYTQENKTLIVSYFLPNSEIVPRVVQHKYVSTRNEIDVISLTDKKFEKFYNDIIFMSCLKTIKEIILSDDMNNIDNIVYNGWVKYIDKSTGKYAESCIITLETSKIKFSEINLKNVDYKECIKGLKGIFAPSILSITPVIPYKKIDRSDSRFIESKDVTDIELNGFNLATMPWEDFEYFVRELFDKMFNVNGGEVKVTQASHDGGVDAIAFDDDPIRGGKFVIQAKRYNNVVPVSAVRDLYGTMIHEGATKGILVTTSSYGKESYDFSSDKPITLIDGQALLGLLNKYGYGNLTIKVRK